MFISIEDPVVEMLSEAKEINAVNFCVFLCHGKIIRHLCQEGEGNSGRINIR